MVLANRTGIPPHELLGFDYVPAFIVEDARLVLDAEAAHSPDTSKPTQDLLAMERKQQ